MGKKKEVSKMRNISTSFIALIFLALSIGCTNSSSIAPTISSSFDADTEGWTVLDFLSGSFYRELGGTDTPSWEAEGGLEGGYIGFQDVTHLAFFFNAPDQFLGDKSEYFGGSIQFAVNTNFNDWPTDSFILLGGDNTILYLKFGLPPQTEQWIEHTIDLNPTAEWYLDINQEEKPTEEKMRSVLANLEFLRISGEFAEDLKEKSQLDSVSLIAPVP